MKTVYLNLHKARSEGFVVNREAWLQTYSVIKSSAKRSSDDFSAVKSDKYMQPYRMLQGTRNLFNVEGTYIYLDELPNLCLNMKDAEIANKYVLTVKHGQKMELLVDFRWRR